MTTTDTASTPHRDLLLDLLSVAGADYLTSEQRDSALRTADELDRLNSVNCQP